jgi:ankyrin repeat protein
MSNLDNPWETATEASDVGALQDLLLKGADIDARDRHGQTALMIASHRGHTDVVRFLIEHDADLNHTAKYHLSALMLAVIGGHEEIVRVLVASGADKEIRGTGAYGFHGKTALDLAVAQGHAGIAEILRRG